jgi:hypothetical protein
MRAQELDDLRAYGEKLRSYSTEELEDIYFRINVLRQPLRYNLVRRELDSRRLQAHAATRLTLRQGVLRDWVFSTRLLSGTQWLAPTVFSLLVAVLTAAATFLLLLPIWVFAIPLNFLGLETAIVYMACAPVPPILAAGFGGKLGGRGWYGVWVLAGVIVGMFLFNLTGAPSTIIRSAVAHTSGGGFSIGGF